MEGAGKEPLSAGLMGLELGKSTALTEAETRILMQPDPPREGYN